MILALVAALSFAQSKADDTPTAAHSTEELRLQLTTILKDSHTPGMAVAIVHRDQPEWIAGVGDADVAAHRTAGPQTLFRIGSTSKAFVSLSILKLANEGKLSLQDPVRKLVPEVWFENPWEATDPVRVVDLLEHTTGWDDLHLREYAKDAPGMGLREGLDYDHHSRISRWRPGTRMAYCNSGPAVAAYIVEKISAQRFEDYVAQNFFQPIGMKTATYFQPAATQLTSLYHPDGKTTYAYWNILLRPAGSINASAEDMAAYVRFYLNRGTVDGKQVLPAASLDRMEIPTRTWAAQQGLSAGYGLSNYWSVDEGFVYHGHDGGVEGGLTEMGYIPDADVGYFFSINSGDGEAFAAIGRHIRAYITRDLQRPFVPPVAALPANAESYAGWYEPDSPRMELTHFLERLLGIDRVRIEAGKLIVESLGKGNRTFVPVTGAQFRLVPMKGFPEPIAGLELLTPVAEGRFMQIRSTTLKQIPTWLAITEVAAVAWVMLSWVSVLGYAPFWLLGGLSKKRRRPTERAMRAWPLVAVLSLVGAAGVITISSADPIARMGNLSVWSAAICLLTLLYGVAAAAGAVVLWRTPRQAIRRAVRIYSMIVIPALLIAAAYLAYWGIIGLRTWA